MSNHTRLLKPVFRLVCLYERPNLFVFTLTACCVTCSKRCLRFTQIVSHKRTFPSAWRGTWRLTSLLGGGVRGGVGGRCGGTVGCLWVKVRPAFELPVTEDNSFGNKPWIRSPFMNLSYPVHICSSSPPPPPCRWIHTSGQGRAGSKLLSGRTICHADVYSQHIVLMSGVECCKSWNWAVCMADCPAAATDASEELDLRVVTGHDGTLPQGCKMQLFWKICSSEVGLKSS